MGLAAASKASLSDGRVGENAALEASLEIDDDIQDSVKRAVDAARGPGGAFIVEDVIPALRGRCRRWKLLRFRIYRSRSNETR